MTDGVDTTLERVARLHPRLNLGGLLDAGPDHASAICLIDLGGATPSILTYTELRDRVARAAGAFRDLGVTPSDRLALCLPNSAEFVISFLSLLRIGAIPVLANPQLNREALRHVLLDSGSTGILTDPAAYPVLAQEAEAMSLRWRLALGATSSGWRDLDRLIREAPPDHRIEPRAFDDQAFQPYTAGSSGAPKGIVLTHGGMLWGIEHSQRYWPVRAGDRGIIAAPMFHKNALRGTLKPMLRGGGSVVIMRSFEPRAYLKAIAEYRVTGCAGVPAIFAEILRHDDLLKSLDLSHLRHVSLGSSIVPAELMRRISAALPQAGVHESYGLTEGGGPLRPPLDGRPLPLNSVGVPAPETEVKLMGAGSLDQGELWIRSPYVLKAYANQPRLTKDRIEDGWLKTGDLMRRDGEGFYYFIGRADDMFVCGGENIYPKEVENLLLRHPDVTEAVVVPLPHETKGLAPAALVVPRAASRPRCADIQDFCAREGPAYAIPRAVLIAAAIPLSLAGKPDRTVIRKLLLETFGPTLAATSRRGAS